MSDCLTSTCIDRCACWTRSRRDSDLAQWAGIMLGFGGASLVLADVGGELPVMGLVATGIALLAVTAGTMAKAPG